MSAAGYKVSANYVEAMVLSRSRPHTPAAQATEYTIEQIAEIDNRIRKERKAEREKVIEILSDLNKYSCEEYEEASLSDNEREMRIHLEYGNRTWGIIRSLRGGATEEGGERR
jgi:hypothetical protein